MDDLDESQIIQIHTEDWALYYRKELYKLISDIADVPLRKVVYATAQWAIDAAYYQGVQRGFDYVKDAIHDTV